MMILTTRTTTDIITVPIGKTLLLIKAAQKTFTQFNPSDLVGKWNTPIFIIQGGKDFRVPIEQGLQAFQAAQLRGIKSKLLYLPDENHWVLKPQNALVWQREFYKWLKETL